MHMRRRSFLKMGVAGAIVLAAGGALYRWSRPAVPLQPFALDGDARAVLAALIPSLLATALPDAAQAGGAQRRAAALLRAADGVATAIHGLPLATQKEVQDLFGLLALAPARRWLAGVSSGWQNADAAQVDAFLQSWRTHRLATLQTAYLALHDLVIGAWYADPASWSAIGYPGPLKELA